ncbi:F-box/kelch-repeat protein At1g30090 [Rutidosis leptorrhynchoides]|uniref:F-box/kelch-repeat protein At1g30090 n=1 Tax=Rutidosis leptorrhynchoides TaxID=125765 RepID=UPI003A9939FA
MQRVRVSSQQVPIQKLGDSQLTVSPKFKLTANQSCLLDPFMESDSSLNGDPLIPGLPDDIALSCLLRLPVSSHLSSKSVCRRWYQLFRSKERFFTQRKQMGFKDPWLYVFAFHKCTGKVQWHVLDLTNFLWHTIPQMPCIDKVCPHGFRCVSLPFEGSLFVCGGVVFDADCPLNLVMKFNVQKNSWTVMKKMITPRSFFASGVINGKIYVAGGNSTDLLELNSVEVMDPQKGIWHPVANMRTNMASYDSAVVNGKLFVTEGWFWPFYVVPRGQVYDPKTDNWENLSDGLREGWTGTSVVIYDQLFVVTEHERTKLKVYDMKNDSWKTVDGPALPEQICKPFSVNCCNNRICVVGKNLNVAVGCILRVKECDNRSSRFSVRWKVVEAPAKFCNLTPSSAQVLFG